MNDSVLEPGQQVRLKHDPSRFGVVTGKFRDRGNVRSWQVRFPEGGQYVPSDQIELIAENGDDPLDLLERGRMGVASDLRRTITHARLTGRLADVIYSMDTTGTDFYAYQFKPVIRLMNLAGRGILIADEVGLGKTIEAGLIWTELRTRFDFRRLLVLCPAMLCEKWRLELGKRFGVTADILNAKDTLARLQQAERNNQTGSFAIIASTQGLRPERDWRVGGRDGNGGASSRLACFLDDRGQDDPLIDLCIIDEAHHLRNRETMTSTLGRLVRAVSDYIVLLSATPVHISSDDLFELLRLVDEDTFHRPQAFDEVLEANGPLVRARDLILRRLTVTGPELCDDLQRELRRAREHPLLAGSQQLGALIEDEVWLDDLTRPEVVARLAERLERVNLLGHVVTRTRKRDVEERRVIRDVFAQDVPLSPVEAAFYDAVTGVVRDYCMQHGGHEGFLQVTPQHQMCSSMPAALRLWQRCDTGDDDDTENDLDETDRPLRAELTTRASELGDLDELWRHDSKYKMLRGQLRSLLDREPSVKVVVFSYFRATLRYLHERLGQDDIRTLVLHGGIPDKDATVDRFRESGDCNVLLSSEVGSEGIDLQFARIVVNYDLPWNPMRVEQRIGRVDRIGQQAKKIHVWSLFYKGTLDDRIYHRLFERLKIFEGALGSLETVLGDKIQKLTYDLFSRHLTPEEEERQIELTYLALAAQQLAEDRLEDEAAHLTAYGDYILHQVKAARELHRSISARELRSYVTDFFNLHYVGSEFRQIAEDPMRFDVSLSIQAKRDFAEYLRQLQIPPTTRLTGDTVHYVRCRFENTAVPDHRGREEVISQFHPLVRFVAARLETPEERRRPAVAVRVTTTDIDHAIAPGHYAFSVQRWSVRGLRDMERLHYAAKPLDGQTNSLVPSEAERLIVNTAGRGNAWLGWHELVRRDDLIASVESCLELSERAFKRHVHELDAENADRASVQERMLDEQYRTQRSQIEELLSTYRQRGQVRLVPATEGRLRALGARTERRRLEIDDRRKLQYSPAEILCVGVIEVVSTAAGD